MSASHRTIGLAFALFLAGAGAAAHHSTGAYDMDHQVTLAGTLKSVNWSNPHITFVVEADGKPGDVWTFESSSPGVLGRSGWTKRTLQPGDHATFQYAPLRSQAPGGFLFKVTLADGRTFGFSLTPEPE